MLINVKTFCVASILALAFGCGGAKQPTQQTEVRCAPKLGWPSDSKQLPQSTYQQQEHEKAFMDQQRNLTQGMGYGSPGYSSFGYK